MRAKITEKLRGAINAATEFLTVQTVEGGTEKDVRRVSAEALAEWLGGGAGGGAESPVLIVTGATPLADMLAAYNAGKLVVLFSRGHALTAAEADQSSIRFEGMYREVVSGRVMYFYETMTFASGRPAVGTSETLPTRTDVEDAQGVLWAVKGETTVGEIVTARTAGKAVLLYDGGRVYTLQAIDTRDGLRTCRFAALDVAGGNLGVQFPTVYSLGCFESRGAFVWNPETHMGSYPVTTTWDSTATSAALAPVASPQLTGLPTAPTPTAGDSSTRIATTAYVQAAIDTAITALREELEEAVEPATLPNTLDSGLLDSMTLA